MYSTHKMDALLRVSGLELPYTIYYPVEGKTLKFYADFIEFLDAYFGNMIEIQPNRSQDLFTKKFAAFAIGGADNDDGAYAALDIYLSTLTGVTNA